MFGSLLFLALDLGGSLYEHLVVDPAWPAKVTIIQPAQGGVNRKVFWIPVHGALTLLLPAALWACWPNQAGRRWALVAVGIYVAMRIWTFVYFVPLALRFESAGELTDAMAREARVWVRWSVIRSSMVVAALAALWMASCRLWPRAA